MSGNAVKSRLSSLDGAKNDEFTTDLPQLTQDTSEKKTLPAMAVFFFICRILNKAPIDRGFLQNMD